MAGVAVALTVFSAVKQYQAGQEAKAIGRENERNILRETEEEARRLSREQGAQEARARAIAAASGIKVKEGESFAEVLGDMSSEHARQLSWLRTAGKSRAKIARKQGAQAASAATAQAASTAASAYGMGRTYGLWGK